MFRISQKTDVPFAPFVLEDTASGCYAEILPDYGATLHAFGIENQQRQIQVIDHYQSEKDFDMAVEQLGYKSCKLSPFPGRLRNGSYRFDGKAYHIEDIGGGEHALHGLLYKKKFKVTETAGGDESAQLKMLYSYNNENPGYPFSYDCIITYTLTSRQELGITTECRNTSPVTIPMQDGWHPYFTLGEKIDELELLFKSRSKYIFDDQLMPTGVIEPYDNYLSFQKLGPAFFDNSFLLDENVGNPVCILRNKKNGVEIQILTDNSYPVLQIYTPPNRNSIAIENLSGPPDAFNLGKGFIPLPPGQRAIFKTSYRINFI